MNYTHLYEDKRLDFVIGTFKFILFLNFLLLFIFHHSIAFFLISEKRKRLKYFIKSISIYSNLALKVLSIRVDINQKLKVCNPYLIVANHQSYTDILILAAHYPSLFISSVEVQETPILGHLCELAGCSFVERRKSKRTEQTKIKEFEEIKERLLDGANITLFPEATTTNGDTVLPFKSTFFQTVIDTQTSVLPVVINYQGESRFVVPWYGEMTFLDHLFRLCQLNEISVTIKELNPIWKNDRFELAQNAHELVLSNYQKI